MKFTIKNVLLWLTPLTILGVLFSPIILKSFILYVVGIVLFACWLGFEVVKDFGDK